MRHGKKVNHLSRQKGHRRALMANLGSSLIEHKRIQTTVAKAKALRVYIEPLITRAKDNSTHNRRIVFKNLQSKHAVSELFDVVGPKIAERPGGYTRIVQLGHRLGDNADMCLIELVDFNDTYVVEKSTATTGTKKRRSRRGGGKSKKEESSESVAAEAPESKTESSIEEVEEIKDEETPDAEDAVQEQSEDGETSDEENTDDKV